MGVHGTQGNSNQYHRLPNTDGFWKASVLSGYSVGRTRAWDSELCRLIRRIRWGHACHLTQKAGVIKSVGGAPGTEAVAKQVPVMKGTARGSWEESSVNLTLYAICRVICCVHECISRTHSPVSMSPERRLWKGQLLQEMLARSEPGLNSWAFLHISCT